ncbi:LysM peptidoglycan-binding domain-containing protein [Paenibacillus alvei]|uniref:LysM peptidoglycan-binding domain-containing protein n=1 Tax=Paenibacillus alvei TaxID=44250 RepID=UPI00028960BE|nr:LysM peptidoglycan-binding domain-containing protein [Paenibacillus alvei]EJW14859.1 LysM domain protein [Paenibacillus alvei DSM 29]MCY9544724.1 LysM peptidoglycan-binding domain-containing protein [Paenibacillus alvei]MCY9708378.1 LysM peptidoglycan-binding domain-containing protein [Paenibacillus alvei]MEC0083262.1 LysM peptidoglycan-binding domain-containing protein [Paenibacillus alvei]
MEFWLTRKNGVEKLWFPIPAREFRIDGTRHITKEYVNGSGEIALAGKKQLTTISFSSWIPAAPRNRYAQYPNYPLAYEFIDELERWKNDTVTCRFFITNTSVNFACLIESFSYYERPGSRDVEFELSLCEYRYLSQEKAAAKQGRPLPATYTFKSTDTIYKVARTYYGDAQKFLTICKANGIKNPDKIKTGTVLRLPR